MKKESEMKKLERRQSEKMEWKRKVRIGEESKSGVRTKIKLRKWVKNREEK